MSLKVRLQEDMKTAMKAKESARLSAIRLALAAIKQIEVDERIELDDAAIVAVIDKLLKQRRDAASQYEAADRLDLAAAERFEIDVLGAYLPQALTSDEIDALIEAAIAESGARAASEMGKVMALVKPKAAGRADMAEVSRRIKEALNRQTD